MDTAKIAEEIAGAVLAACAPGVTPSHSLLVREFVNAYDLFGISPTEQQHQEIADRVGALIRVRD
jgi:hypothetical protein